VADWPLMSAYWPTIALTAAYLIIVCAGPKLMNSRPALEFRWTLFLYNAGLVALNCHICSEVCQTNCWTTVADCCLLFVAAFFGVFWLCTTLQHFMYVMSVARHHWT